MERINSPTLVSLITSGSSQITKNKSNLDIRGADKLILCFNAFDLSYLPNNGLAAARIDVLAFNVAYIPALAIEIVCCYIASWIATWSFTSILSNSSIQQTPLSANINAPAYNPTSPFSSLVTVAVRPAADVVLPLV